MEFINRHGKILEYNVFVSEDQEFILDMWIWDVY